MSFKGNVFFLFVAFILHANFVFPQNNKYQQHQEAEVLYELARTSYEENKTEEAKMYVDSAIFLNQDNADFWYLKGLIDDVQGNTIEALTSYETASKLNSAHLESYLGKAMIYYRQKNYEQALDDYNYILRYNGTIDTKAIYYQSMGYGANDNKGETSGVVSLNNMKDDIRYKRALVYRDIGEYEKALGSLNKLISNYPQNSDYLTAKGTVHKAQGELDSAKVSFKAALDLNPEDKAAAYQMHLLDPGYELPQSFLDDNDFHYALAKKGADLFDKGKFKQALKYYNDAIWTAPGVSDYYSSRGLVYSKLDQHEEAIADFQKALNMDSYFVANFYRIGNSYFKLEDFEKANFYYQQYLTFIPDDERVWYNSAMIYLQQKSYDLACKNLREAIRLGFEPAQKKFDKYCK